MHTPHPTSRSLSQKVSLTNHRSHLSKKVLLISCSLAFLNVCFAGLTNVAQSQRGGDDTPTMLARADKPKSKRKPAKSAASDNDVGLDFVTPDHKGGVWLSGDVFELRGFLLNNDRDGNLQMITVRGVSTISEPLFVSRQVGWMTDRDFLFQTQDGGTSWSKIDSLPLSGIYSFYFKDVNNGWVGNRSGDIVRTTDGGKTWKKRRTGLNYKIKQIFFVDPLHGWATATKILPTSDSTAKQMTALLRTVDGGETWAVLLNVDDFDPRSIRTMLFVDSREGWGIGSWKQNIIHTADGGKTWSIQQPHVKSGWNSLTFIDNKEGWAAGGDGIIHTSDGGKNWEYQFDPTSSPWAFESGITFIDRKNGWAISGDRGLRTTDGGATWKPILDDWKSMLPSYKDLSRQEARPAPPITGPSALAAAAPLVSLCDLAARPETYDKKRVRVDAMAVASFEVSFLYDSKCSNDWGINLEFDTDDGQKIAPFREFPEGKNSVRRAYVTLFGRFDAPDGRGYGHLNSFPLRFVASEVLKADRVPKNVPDPYGGKPKR